MRERLKSCGQEHLLAFWNEIGENGRANLAGQINEIDWATLPRLLDEYVLGKPSVATHGEIRPAPYYPLRPVDPAQSALYLHAAEEGKRLLGSGRVAALTVAGGQGTRLGFDGPKGTFPITPVKEKTLFQVFAESLLRAGEKFGHPLPWLIMTSRLNDSATRSFFAANRHFGIDPEQIRFFSQGTMPVFGFDGRILLDAKDTVATSPDGHGGTLLALRSSGLLDEMRKIGVDYFSYFQVDNPLVSTVDPLFLGLHHLEGSEMSARMLPKTGPFEKLGNFCIVDGQLVVIEYSDMPDNLAEARNADGTLRFLAGSPAIHVISRDFVERLTEKGILKLPWHRAEKKVAHLAPDGTRIEPSEPNAIKLESFIFDAFPLAAKTMILEAAREEQFAPTKNRIGVDSVESCRNMLVERDARRLEAAGIRVPRKPDGTPDCRVELSSRHYFDDDDVIATAASIKPPVPGESVYYS